MTDDLISRQAAIEALKRAEALTRAFGYHNVIETIRDLPTAEPSTTIMKVEVGVDKESLRKAMEETELTLVAEPRKGKWIKDRLSSTLGGSYGAYRCSECESSYQDIGYGWNYCPNCGARMEE